MDHMKLLLALSLFLPASAQAVPPASFRCEDYSCDGTSPQSWQTNCAYGAFAANQTTGRLYTPRGVLTLMYGPGWWTTDGDGRRFKTCRTNYGRFQPDKRGVYSVWIVRRPIDGRPETTISTRFEYTGRERFRTWETDQLYAPIAQVKACFNYQINEAAERWSEPQCTAWI